MAIRKYKVRKSEARKSGEDSFDPVLNIQWPQEESTENLQCRISIVSRWLRNFHYAFRKMQLCCCLYRTQIIALNKYLFFVGLSSTQKKSAEVFVFIVPPPPTSNAYTWIFRISTFHGKNFQNFVYFSMAMHDWQTAERLQQEVTSHKVTPTEFFIPELTAVLALWKVST